MAGKPHQHGSKTHEQFLRSLERKEDVPKAGEVESASEQPAAVTRTPSDPEARRSEFAVSRRGMNQESRDHNKHNHPGQSGYKPQKHSPAEEKH